MKQRLLTFGIVGLLIALTLSGTVYGIRNFQSAASVPPQTRTFFIAADEVAWDYAPSGFNQYTGQPFDDTANIYVQPGPQRIGKVYTKAQYREYTDGTFTHLKPVPSQWQHLGILGPAIHAQVGDTIRFVFKNNTTLPTSVHPHGVFYAKNAEGAPYSDGTSGSNKADDAVAPGGIFTYVWSVPARAGPAPMDGSSAIWMYHSHVDEPGDTNAGLIGPIIVTAQGKAKSDGSPIDVDRELVTMFTVFDENTSRYLQTNIDTRTDGTVDPNDEDFIESNKMHSINGYVFGNLPLSSVTVHRGERVRWYVIAQGTEVDLHTPHWHGNTVVINGMRTDVAELLPMSMKVADMTPDDLGIWAYHCHVNDHIIAGMLARYQVIP